MFAIVGQPFGNSGYFAFHNTTFDGPFLSLAGFTLSRTILDSRLLAREALERSEANYKLKNLANKYLPAYETKILKDLAKHPRFAELEKKSA